MASHLWKTGGSDGCVLLLCNDVGVGRNPPGFWDYGICVGGVEVYVKRAVPDRLSYIAWHWSVI